MMNREELLKRIRNLYNYTIGFEELLFEMFNDINECGDDFYSIYVRSKIPFLENYLEDLQNFVNDVKYTFYGKE